MRCIEKEIWNPPHSPYLDWIRSGVKKYEGKTADKIGLWNLTTVNAITFYDRDHPNDKVTCNVLGWKQYDSFGDAYDDLGDALIPNSNREKVIELYREIYKRDVKNVIAIEIEVKS